MEPSRVAAKELIGKTEPLSPSDGALTAATLSPRLTPWATIFRRSAAEFAGAGQKPICARRCIPKLAVECARRGRRNIRTPADGHSCGFRRENISAPETGALHGQLEDALCARPPTCRGPLRGKNSPGRRPALRPAAASARNQRHRRSTFPLHTLVCRHVRTAKNYHWFRPGRADLKP